MEQSKITIEQYIGFEKKQAMGTKTKVQWGKIVSFIILTLFCILWISPFVIMFLGSLRGYSDTLQYPKELFYPHSGYTLENYKILLFNEFPPGVVHNTVQKFQIGYWLMNSCFSAIGGTLLYLLVASLAAYAFVFLDFKYRNVIFGILIATMVIPGAATAVGNQSIVFGTNLHKVGVLALIIPGLGGVYGMYLIKTFFEAIPKDLVESARMDGYSNFKIFRKIVLPLGKTALFVQGLFGFMGGWNDLIWPQMLYGTMDTKRWTLQVGMAYIINNTKNASLVGTALAGGVVCLVPVLIVYIIAQNKIIEGMAGAGIKRQVKKMRNEYPRPDFVRDSFISLCDTWDFDFDDNNEGHKKRWFQNHEYTRKIEVPFCFESELSGIHDTGYHDHVWYHKHLDSLSLLPDERCILHFEGADYVTEVYVNGCLLKTHYGSNGSFKVDITDYLEEENHLTVYCFDPGKDRSIPRGKQDWEPTGHAIWYTRTTGIYKPVWMQVVKNEHIDEFYITTKLDGYEVSIDVETTIDEGSIEFIVNDHAFDKKFRFALTGKKGIYTFLLPNDYVNDRVWSIGHPFLFDLTMHLYDKDGNQRDTVKSYFGMREVSTQNGYVLLNHVPIYQKLVLNQGYYPHGILTAPTISDMEKDIDAMIEMGFNGCRIHQKTEDPYFLYLCDKKGFLIWQECASNYGFNSYSQRRMLNEWIDIVKNNFNHPSIICYTPLNESWGIEGIPYDKKIQAFAMSLYEMIHSLDASRLVISNDGWEHCTTDLLTVHNYGHGEKEDKERYLKFAKDLSTRDEILKFSCISRFILNPGFEDHGQPILLSEFGGVAFKKDAHGKAWGYTTCQNEEEYEADLRRIYAAIAKSTCIQGICYTQLTDVEQEVNGLMTFERKYKIDPSIIKEINDTLGIKQEE